MDLLPPSSELLQLERILAWAGKEAHHEDKAAA